MPSSTEDEATKESNQTVRQDFIDVFTLRVTKALSKHLDKTVSQVDGKFPSNAEDVRSLPFYNSTLDAIKYQRDNYLVGSEYASRRQRDRNRNILSNPDKPIPFDSKALGNEQIVNLGAWFIPSPTIQNALLPVVVSLPSGVLRETITNTVANAIPLAQPLLDDAVKWSLMQVLDNPEWRQLIKNRAGGYMSSRRGSIARRETSNM
eukprot:Nitzschia sp. Nitz4//scaffold82_size85912//56323//56940//NITZ4_005147-RA/size85912-processed-gene-0.14-mRNA-1//1//CDS//3329558853//2335//frame0